MKTKKHFPSNWYPFVKDFENILSPILEDLRERKNEEYIVPLAGHIFKPFEVCNFLNMKVVILADRPYHQVTTSNTPIANGLCYSTNIPKIEPDSLKAICAEVLSAQEDTFNAKLLETPLRKQWGENVARQGVLMLNNTVTCTTSDGLAHENLWQPWSAALVKKLGDLDRPLVWVLLDKKMKMYSSDINTSKGHIIIESNKPALSSSFLGKNLISKINRSLVSLDHKPLHW